MNKIFLIDKKTKYFLFALLMIFSFASVYWIILPGNRFIMDDYSLLLGAKQTSYQHIFSLLPNLRYNDRPVRTLFLKLIIDTFGLDNVVMHIIMVLIHMFNVALVYLCVRKAFQSEKSFYYAIVAAGIFGIYPKSLMAVSWASAVVDLLCATFVLLSVYCFLYFYEKKKYYVFYGVLSVVFYMLALRSKEMALFLPAFMLVYDLISKFSKKQKLIPNIFTVINCVWMLIYTARLFSLPGESGNPYQQTFNPIIMIKDLIKYFGIYTDLTRGDFGYTNFNLSMILGIFLIAAISVLFLIIVIRKKEYSLLAWAAGIVFLFAPVLTMEFMQHKLYLYVPSIFMGVCFAYAAVNVFAKFFKSGIFESVSLTLLVLVLLNFTPGIVGHANYWFSLGSRDRAQIKQVERLSYLKPSTTVYVKGASKSYNIIYPYGPGDSLRLIYNDATIKTVLVDEFPDDPEAPYVFWNFDGNTFTEIKSDMGVVS